MLQRSLRGAASAAVCLLLTIEATGQKSALTVEDIYSYEGWLRFNGHPSAPMNWAPAGDPWVSDHEHLWPSNSSSWLRVDAVTGSAEPLYDQAQVESALRTIGVSAGDAQSAARARPSIFDARKSTFLMTVGDDLYAYDIPSRRASRLTESAGAKRVATFSPDGRQVAYVKDNNLFVTTVASPSERALTSDGSTKVLNGILDWVYSEELYGRGNHRGYWWSPDSSRIAFLQLDDTLVPEAVLMHDLSYRPSVERWPYPRAGDPNPVARLGVAAIGDTSITWIDTSGYSEFLIVSVTWSADGAHVVYQVQNRQQTWLDLNRADAAAGKPHTILRETSKTWVERWQDPSVDPIWLKDGSFLWLSERTGWRHVYHYTSGGSLIRQLTNGDWEVRRAHGVDPSGTWFYFAATADSVLGLDVYRTRLSGGGMERLVPVDGSHRAFFNPSRSLFLDAWSDVTTPPQVRLHRSHTGELVRVVEANPAPGAREQRLSKPELLQVKTRDGFVMEAMMIKPPNFDPTKRYPVYQFTYGAPHVQTVTNAWGFNDFLYHQLLAERGIIVWICDNRTASGKGMQSAWPVYKGLGAVELSDIEDGISWLTRQPFVDGSRVGIAGVSYGGYLVLHALTNSRSFTMGIAEAAVSDWRNYDSIYTERYLGLPADNPEGYRRSSPRFNAARLSGNLLLIHGALDDNVHPQNSTQFAFALQRAGKPFQMMVYPNSAHGATEAELVPHLRRTMLDFTTQNLLR